LNRVRGGKGREENGKGVENKSEGNDGVVKITSFNKEIVIKFT
jgi:hypothetical protein